MVKKYIRVYDNGIVDTKEVDRFEKKPKDIGRFVPVSKGIMVNKETGEVIEASQPETKIDSLDSVIRSMLHNRQKVLANVDIKKQICYHVIFTNAEMVSFEEFDKHAKSLARKLKYAFGNKIYYALFMEANEFGRYHLHSILAFDKNLENFNFEDPNFSQFSRIGGKKNGNQIGQVRTIPIKRTYEDLQKVVFYLSNYSRADTNKKVQDKIKGLKYFPAGIHLVRMPDGEDIPDEKEVDDFKPYIKDKTEFSSSKRINAKGVFKYGTNLPKVEKCA
jgi:hypothetical protein